jgi:hypothetical protein
VIPAGGSGKLVAKVKTRGNQNGRLSKRVSVTTDAPGKERLQLSLSFNAVAAIIARPRPNLYLNSVVGRAGSARILLHRPDGEALRLTVPEGSLPEGIKLNLIEVTEEEPGEQRFDPKPGDVWVEVAVGEDSSTGTFNRNLELITNHPQAPRFPVQLMVRVQPVFALRPTRVGLRVSGDGTGGSTAAVRITNAEHQAFAISGIEVSHPEIFSAEVVANEPRPVHTVRIRSVPDLDPEKIDGNLRGTVKITVSGSTEEVLEAQVTVGARRGR